MKAIVFFGGVAYSGKSTLIDSLSKESQNSIETYSIDSARDYIISNQDHFFTALEQWSPLFKTEFLRRFTISKHNDIVVFLLETNTCSLDLGPKNPFLHQFLLLKDYSALAYIAKQMQTSKADYFIVEGSFLNKKMRIATFDFLSQTVLTFNKTPKYFFYLNLPLNVLLRRKEKAKTRKEKSTQIKKSSIKNAYLTQEVIDSNELDQVKIHVIKSIKEAPLDIPFHKLL